jgi:formylglycine-generating enzyme required for sulfatase activity
VISDTCFSGVLQVARAILSAGTGHSSELLRGLHRSGRALAVLAAVAIIGGPDSAVLAAGETRPVHRPSRRLHPRPPAGEVTITLPGGVPLVLVLIRGGTPFAMGTLADEPGGSPYEMPQHQVTVAHDYYLGKLEVTQAQWQAVMGSNPSLFSSCGPTCPVERASWNDIAGPSGFIETLNQQQGTTKFRLPSEAEWEHAARAGTATRFWYGDALECADNCLPCLAPAPYMWWCGNASSTTHPVGQKPANPWGLSDMNGNVWEWVEDCWHDDYTGAPADGSAWLDPSCTVRVYRGGGWFNSPDSCRSASRNSGRPSVRASALGFRLASSP